MRRVWVAVFTLSTGRLFDSAQRLTATDLLLPDMEAL